MQYLIIRDLTKADYKEEYRMKHIVVDLEMNNIRQKSEALEYARWKLLRSVQSC